MNKFLAAAAVTAALGAYPAKADEQLDSRLDRIEEYLEIQQARQALADLEQYRAQVARERAAAEAERAARAAIEPFVPAPGAQPENVCYVPHCRD